MADVGAPIPRYVSEKRKPGTPKRQWRDRSQSLYVGEIDSVKDGELKGTRPELEVKMENIWKDFKEDEIDEKEQLVNLIDDFHSQYLSLYRRYDHLIEALRKKAAEGKHGNDSASSGAYFSDSDDSPAKHIAKNGGLEKSPEKDIDGVLQEFELALVEVAELMKKLAITTREKDALNKENASTLSKLHEAQQIPTALNAEAEKWNEERSRLLTENADLSQKLEDKDAEKQCLRSEIEVAVGIIEEVKSTSNDLRSINGRLQLERDAMQLDLEWVKRESSILREKLELAENELAKQSQIQQAALQEKVGLSSKISQLEEEVKHKEDKIQELESVKRENSTLREKLEFAEDEIAKQSQAAQQVKNGLSSRISQLEEEIKQKENKIKVLVTESNQLSEKLAGKDRELSCQIENFEAHKEAEKAKLESAEKEVAKVNQMVKAAEEENMILSLKICQLEDRMKQSKEKIQHLVTEASQLNAKLAEKERGLSRHMEIQVAQKEQASTQVSDLLVSLDMVSMKYEECSTNFLNRISKASCELKFARDWARRKNDELSHMKDATDGMLSQLDDKESEILILREKVWKLENKSRELERIMNEKEESILGFQEEKREAIRQLCVWIDHHRSRSDYYKRKLSEMNSDRETQISVGSKDGKQIL